MGVTWVGILPRQEIRGCFGRVKILTFYDSIVITLIWKISLSTNLGLSVVNETDSLYQLSICLNKGYV
jgi:hypothetical protein